MSSGRSKREAEEEQRARERGRTLPHYAGKVTKTLTKPPKSGVFTPSKKAGDDENKASKSP